MPQVRQNINTGNISFSGNQIGTLNDQGVTFASPFSGGNVDDWNSAFTTVQTNSATTWNYQGTDLKALSANWQNSYTTVRSNSANWGGAYTWVRSNSASATFTNLTVNNNTFLNAVTGTKFTIVRTTTASGGEEGGIITTVTTPFTVDSLGNVKATGFTTLSTTLLSANTTTPVVQIIQAGSGNALIISDQTNDTTSFIIDGSGNAIVGGLSAALNAKLTVYGNISANGTIYDLTSNSSQWKSAYTTVNSNSAQWASNIDTGVRSLSSNWQSTHTTVNSNSGKWEGAYTWVNTNSASSLITSNTTIANLTATNLRVTTSATVATSGTTPSFQVTQSGTGNALVVSDQTGDTSPFIIDNNGHVIIGGLTSSSNIELTVYGDISASNTVYASNGVFTALTATSFVVVNETATGIIKADQTEDKFSTYSSNIGSGAVTLDCSNGQIFYITSSVSQNWTANLTNLSLSAGYVGNVKLIVVQGGTPRIPSTLQIGGASQTIKWQGGTPTGNASKTDAFTFNIVNNGGTYIVLGQLVSFG